MHPELFRVGPFALHSYGLMVFLGFAIGIWVAARRAESHGVTKEAIYDVALWILVSSLLGARGLYVLTHRTEFSGRWLDAISPIQSDGTIGIAGLVLLGGVIAATAAVVMFSRVKKVPLWKLTDLYVPGLAIGEFFGRIGCLLNGCCFGLPTHSWLGVIFPEHCAAGAQFPDTPIHPTQLYMSFAALLTAILLLSVERKFKKPGQLFGLYLTLYGPTRILVESIRWYESSMRPLAEYGLSITVSQVLSIGIFIAGLILLFHPPKQAKPVKGKPR